MNNIAVKIKYLNQKLQEENYNLSKQDVVDLKRRLATKPVQLYLLGIDFLKRHNTIVNYLNVRKIIIIDVRIRDNIKKVITALEEAIWIQYFDLKIKYNDLSYFKKSTNNLSKIIEKLDDKSLHQIRQLRNDVSHLVYPLLFNKFTKIMKQINDLKKISFVENAIITKLLIKILEVNRDLNLECIHKLLKEVGSNLDL